MYSSCGTFFNPQNCKNYFTIIFVGLYDSLSILHGRKYKNYNKLHTKKRSKKKEN